MREELVLSTDALLGLYARGQFLMGEGRDDPRLYLVDPPQRGILPLDGLHISRRLARTVRQDLYRVRVDTAFADVLTGCAGGGEDRPETWINPEIERLYLALFAAGHAHSVEVYSAEGELVGGLYGVRLGGAFFGESMFSRARDASKVALVHLVARLVRGGFQLLDCQFQTDHLASLGVIEISKADYRARLKAALKRHGDFYALGASCDGASALQAINHRS